MSDHIEVMRKPSWLVLGVSALVCGFIVGVSVTQGHLSGLGGAVLGVNLTIIVHDLAFGRHP